jgi:hypothetical protein
MVASTRRTQRGTTDSQPPASQPVVLPAAPPPPPAPPPPAPPPEQQQAPKGRKKKMTDNEKIQQARDNNEEEYTSYMTQGNSWNLLTLQENRAAEDTYKDWSISLDGFSLPTQIANYLDKVSRHQLFFDKNFQNAWANKTYMLYLPEEHEWTQEDNFQELRITDIQDGKYLAQNDDATGAKIAQKTEKGYLNNVLNLKT